MHTVPNVFACAFSDSLSGVFVRAMEQHARRLRAEVIKQFGKSLVFLTHMRLSLTCGVRHRLGTSKR